MPSSADDVFHLMKRVGFGATPVRITELANSTIPEIVEWLLDDAAAPRPGAPGFVYDTRLAHWERIAELQKWWLDVMARADWVLVEKMTWFWHGHFTASIEKVYDTPMLWRMHEAQRALCLGNARAMAQNMAIQPAMLWYLDNEDNYAERPNQNFGRELLELFLLGIGNYTEQDVDACARAWTGHHLDHDSATYVFEARYHDYGASTFMGVTRAWNGPEIIDFLFDDPTQRVHVARHLCRKLWSFFAYPNPPATLVASLADVMIAGNFEMKPVLRSLFNRAEFWSPVARNGLVRAPVEYVANVLKQLNLRSADLNPQWMLEGMGQLPFAPPNVSGWRQNRAWVSTSATAAKHEFASTINWRLDPNPFDDLTGLPIVDTVNWAFHRCGLSAPSQRSRDVVTNWLEVQRATPNQGWVESENLLKLMLLLPEMQMA